MTASAFPLTPKMAARYRALRDAALRQIQKYDLSEGAYHRLFNAGLQPLEDFIHAALRELSRPLHDDTERAFADAARETEGKRYGSISDLLTLAAIHHEKLISADFWSMLEKGGAQIQYVYGCLVPAGSNEPWFAAGYGSPTYIDEPALKTRELVGALLDMGIFADDMFIYRGGVLPGMWRKEPYAVIDIPRLGKQIAVCDEIGNTCFVAQKAKPLAFWVASDKETLRAEVDIKDVDYDRGGKWLVDVRDLLLGQDITTVSANRFPKAKVPRASRKALLTEDTIKRWLQTTHEQELKQGRNRWPTGNTKDKTPVWDKGTDGVALIVEGEAWTAIGKAIIQGIRGLKHLEGMTLPQFVENCGFRVSRRSKIRLLNDAILKRWLLTTHEQELKQGIDRWPTGQRNDTSLVWDKDADGKAFIVEGENWKAIGRGVFEGSRGLNHLKRTTLKQFRERNGLGDDGRKRPRRPKSKTALPAVSKSCVPRDGH